MSASDSLSKSVGQSQDFEVSTRSLVDSIASHPKNILEFLDSINENIQNDAWIESFKAKKGFEVFLEALKDLPNSIDEEDYTAFVGGLDKICTHNLVVEQLATPSFFVTLTKGLHHGGRNVLILSFLAKLIRKNHPHGIAETFTESLKMLPSKLFLRVIIDCLDPIWSIEENTAAFDLILGMITSSSSDQKAHKVIRQLHQYDIWFRVSELETQGKLQDQIAKLREVENQVETKTSIGDVEHEQSKNQYKQVSESLLSKFASRPSYLHKVTDLLSVLEGAEDDNMETSVEVVDELISLAKAGLSVRNPLDIKKELKIGMSLEEFESTLEREKQRILNDLKGKMDAPKEVKPDASVVDQIAAPAPPPPPAPAPAPAPGTNIPPPPPPPSTSGFNGAPPPPFGGLAASDQVPPAFRVVGDERLEALKKLPWPKENPKTIHVIQNVEKFAGSVWSQVKFEEHWEKLDAVRLREKFVQKKAPAASSSKPQASGLSSLITDEKKKMNLGIGLRSISNYIQFVDKVYQFDENLTESVLKALQSGWPAPEDIESIENAKRSNTPLVKLDEMFLHASKKEKFNEVLESLITYKKMALIIATIEEALKARQNSLDEIMGSTSLRYTLEVILAHVNYLQQKNKAKHSLDLNSLTKVNEISASSFNMSKAIILYMKHFSSVVDFKKDMPSLQIVMANISMETGGQETYKDRLEDTLNEFDKGMKAISSLRKTLRQDIQNGEVEILLRNLEIHEKYLTSTKEEFDVQQVEISKKYQSLLDYLGIFDTKHGMMETFCKLNTFITNLQTTAGDILKNSGLYGNYFSEVVPKPSTSPLSSSSELSLSTTQQNQAPNSPANIFWYIPTILTVPQLSYIPDRRPAPLVKGQAPAPLHKITKFVRR